MADPKTASSRNKFQGWIRRFWQTTVRGAWTQYRWLLTGILWLAALILGYIGFTKHAIALKEPKSPWDLIYLTLQLISMNSGAVSAPVNWQLNVARLLLPALAAFTAIQAFSILFQEQVALIQLRLIRNHIVICGLSHKGFLLVKSFRSQGDRVVVIEKNEGNAFLEQCKTRGAIIIQGDATDREILRRAAISRAKAIIAVCDDDGTNAEIAVQARQIVQEHPRGPLTCVIHVFEPQLYALLREHEMGDEINANFRLELFNVYDRGARLLLQEFSAVFPSESEPNAPRHMVVVGLGKMGESLVMHVTRNWWEMCSHSGKSLRITVVDREAIWKVESLQVRYPRLADSCELIACEIDVRTPTFQRGQFLPDDHEVAKVDLFCVCLDDDALSLHTGLNLLRLTRKSGVPIVVRVSERGGVANLFNKETGYQNAFMGLLAFGLLERTLTPELLLGGTHEVLAREIHNEYLRLQLLAGIPLTSSDAMVPWHELPERLKESNRQQVDRMGAKLRAIQCRITSLTDWDAAAFKFTPEEIELMAQMEHETWVQQQRFEGWTYHAGPKDSDKKTHPDLMPWEKLPEVEKEKNRSTVSSIPRFLARAGFQIERRGL